MAPFWDQMKNGPRLEKRSKNDSLLIHQSMKVSICPQNTQVSLTLPWILVSSSRFLFFPPTFSSRSFARIFFPLFRHFLVSFFFFFSILFSLRSLSFSVSLHCHYNFFLWFCSHLPSTSAPTKPFVVISHLSSLSEFNQSSLGQFENLSPCPQSEILLAALSAWEKPNTKYTSVFRFDEERGE